MAHLNLEGSLSHARLRDLLMSVSPANLSGDRTAGPICPTEDSHVHHIMRACLPYHFYYPELGQIVVERKVLIGSTRTEDMYGRKEWYALIN